MKFVRQAEMRGHLLEALQECSSHLAESHAGGWVVSLLDHLVEVHVRGDWLLLRVLLPPSATETDAAACLRRGAELPGGVKIALVASSDAAALQVQMDLVLDEEGDLPVQVRGACLTFEKALQSLASHDHGEIRADAGEPPPDLRCSIAEAGWTCDERPEGTLVVDLQVANAFHQAAVEVRGHETRLAVDLAGVESVPEVCKRAAAAFLLRVAGAARMVRPILPPEVGAPRLEVVLPNPTTAAQIGHALAALSVACSLCAREVEVVLRDERIAALYLARCDSSAAPERSETEASGPSSADASS
jgi:hypothetical protein